jgi:AcrR family transcriptional regulator
MSIQPPRPLTAETHDPLPLPRGRHRLPLEVVTENQRRRLIAGVARALAEQGYAELTVKHVIEAAGVSRATFYANFDNKLDCVLVAHEEAFDRLLSRIVRACAAEREWPLKVKAAIAAAIAFAAADPCQARLLTVDALGSDSALMRRVIDSNGHLAVLLREGRRQSPAGYALPEVVEEALIGGLSAIVVGRLAEGAASELVDLEPELVQLVLTQYVGAEEAARVASGGKG